MKLHTNTITSAHVYDACSAAGRSVRPTTFELVGSRSHTRGYDINLTGSNTRWQNVGTRYPNKERHYAATYDEWGRFLAFLFEIDPGMKAGPYTGRADFHTITKGAYLIEASV